MLSDDILSMRLLIVGGSLSTISSAAGAARSANGNTHGPTEATVIATFTDCYPDRR
jgi:hypothetical protein